MSSEVVGDLEAVTSSIQPSTSVRPDAKTQRYDRQLRLWASAGQTALENASILVVNATPTATQVLKNLVLPGIGSFTILDDKKVEGSDLGANFFLVSDSMGKSRAEEAVIYLQELNESVKGKALQEDIPTFLSHEPSLLPAYSLIISVNASTKDTLALASACWSSGVPLITVRSSGFISSLRTQVGEVAFVETHPDSLVDLRLDKPFPALLDYAKSLDVDSMDSAEHGHLPAVVIILRALESYKASNDGALPKTTKERNALKALITQGRRSADEENFDEALALVIKLARPSIVPDNITKLFSDPQCTNPVPSSPPFWLLLCAVKEFVAAENLLPLTGSLPDMKATSKGYLTLQSLYRTKAKEDLISVTQHLHKILVSIGLPTTAIPEQEIATFVKHAAYLEVMRGTNLVEEFEHGPASLPADLLLAKLENDEESCVQWFMALRVAEEYERKNGKFPGSTEEDEMMSLAKVVLERYGVKDLGQLSDSLTEAIQEVIRGGGGDMPQIAALMGGIVSQEAIKLTTRQYVALNGTCVFDGIKSRTGVIA